MKKIEKNTFFQKNILLWHKNDNKRLMPWKEEKDPYKIWLSEIILQQTRVEQGLAYYNKFIIKYPSINDLALAPEQEVFKMWEGLGYYSRCKNLIATARFISFELKGIFPNEYENILQLKGVGPYTAAAIASFAYNLPNAVVDGNVLRVLARFFGDHTPIDSTIGKKQFHTLAHQLLGKATPALYNQAIMDFGATVCKPQLPICVSCVLKKECIAFKKSTVKELPIKEKKIIKTQRFFYYIIATFNNKIYVRKRTEKDVWQNLWEFILVEENKKISVDDFMTSSKYTSIISEKNVLKKVSSFYKQQLTHQTIEGVFIHIELNAAFKNNQFIAVDKKQMNTLAFPRLITNYFEKTAYKS
jgi:A/G-specific adenine glycosylase